MEHKIIDMLMFSRSFTCAMEEQVLEIALTVKKRNES